MKTRYLPTAPYKSGKARVDMGIDPFLRPLAKGYTAPGYESVRGVFNQHLHTIEKDAQVCCYVNGVKVIDLFGSNPTTTKSNPTPPHQYTGTTVQNVYSSTKAITSIVVAMLEDRGHLGYHQFVSDIWPEYGTQGKASTTIAQVMRHEAGLPWLQLPAKDLTTAQIKKGAVSATIANAKPTFPCGSSNVQDRTTDVHTDDRRWREYHVTSRGMIVNEIVRRADPMGRTIGEFVEQEIAIPLGISTNELFIGAKHNDQFNNIADITSMFEFHWHTWQSIVLPSFLGGNTIPLKSYWLKFWLALGIPLAALVASTGVLQERVSRVIQGVGTSSKEAATASNPYNSVEIRSIEMPSANGHSNARALAAMATVIVEGGQLGEQRLLSEEGVRRAVGNGVKDSMGLAGRLTNADFNPTNVFTNAGFCAFRETPRGQGRDGWTGWLGVGGSVLQWYSNDEEEYRIGFGFCGTGLHLIPTNERALKLQNAVQTCCEAIIKRRRLRTSKL